MKLQTGDSVSKEKVARMEHKTRLKEIELEMKKTEMQAELQKQQLEMEMKKRELELAVEKMNIQQKMISNLSSMYCLTPEQRNFNCSCKIFL